MCKENIWDKLVSLKEASEKYNRDTSTLKRAISNGTLVEGIDCKKFGRDWAILISSLDRVYIEERKNLKK
ncbi:hypothetical protein [Clostridium botulinum]|uniref:hypothetical protein n=1 Tax=Clostridium botulinum TaxID=1491 RepID=UPI0019672ABF|nr:hypothetical protein [Clostridium botulinum]MBN1058593.1 hypothetical protein [Clostridium botulinum]